MNHSVIISILVFLVSGYFLAACTSDNPFGSQNQAKVADYNEKLLQLAILVDKEVGDAGANHLQQCSTIAFGNKPCGGPWGYLVYSEQVSDRQTLKYLNENYSYNEGIRNKEEGLFSTCEYLLPPELVIKDGACHGESTYALNPGELLEREKRIYDNLTQND